jgi:DNA-binding winged helix-turn-helix (wHTH) protein
MQALVTLARADGAVVSRDELIRQCWGGRIVGNDAINNCISKIRQLSDLGDGSAFEVETIPRVGYRLIRAQTDDASTATQSPVAKPQLDATTAPSQHETSPWPIIAILAALAVTVAGAWFVHAFFFGPPARNASWQVASYEYAATTGMEERMPALSPDARFLVYWAAPDLTANTRLYLKNILQDQATPFSSPQPGWGDLAAAWSPQVIASHSYACAKAPRKSRQYPA